jgi:Zn finger protein HypA/HybF involved in hydrogenase expression
MNKSNCDIKTQLIVAYQNASEIYSKAVADLTLAIGKVDRIEHEKLSLAAERARLVTTERRADLDMHIFDHEC